MRSYTADFATTIPAMAMADIKERGDNHFYIIASDNNDYRLRLPAACPPLARRLHAACPPLARRLPAVCPPLARRLPAAEVDIIYLSMGGHPISK